MKKCRSPSGNRWNLSLLWLEKNGKSSWCLTSSKTTKVSISKYKTCSKSINSIAKPEETVHVSIGRSPFAFYKIFLLEKIRLCNTIWLRKCKTPNKCCWRPNTKEWFFRISLTCSWKNWRTKKWRTSTTYLWRCAILRFQTISR